MLRWPTSVPLLAFLPGFESMLGDHVAQPDRRGALGIAAEVADFIRTNGGQVPSLPEAEEAEIVEPEAETTTVEVDAEAEREATDAEGTDARTL